MNAGRKNRTSRFAALLTIVALSVVGARAEAQPASQQDPARPAQGEKTIPLAPELDPLTPQEVETLLEELAKVELDLEVHRDFAAAEQRLEELWVDASRGETYDGQWTLLVRLALARSRIYSEIHQPENALAQLDRLLYVVHTTSRDPNAYPALVTATGKRLAEEQDHLADPQLEAARKALFEELQRQQGLQGGGTGSVLDREDPFVQRVAELLEKGNTSALSGLGPHLIPVLAELVLEDLEDYPRSLGDDPLYLILKESPVRAASVCRRGLEGGGQLWRSRILRVFGWSGGPRLGDGPLERRQSAELWGATVEALVTSPDSRAAGLPYALEVYAAGHRSPALEMAILSAWRSEDPALRHGVLSYLEHENDLTPYQPILLLMLEQGDEEERHLASNWLARRCQDLGGLREYAADPDPEVRANLARGLRRQYDHSQPSLSETDRALVEFLARDPSVEVRRNIVEVLDRDLVGPAPFDAYIALAQDIEVEIRRQVAHVPFPNNEIRLRLLEILAADDDPDIQQWVDRWLGSAPSGAELEYWLPTLRARLAKLSTSPTGPLDDDYWWSTYHQFFGALYGTEELVQVALERDDLALLARIVQMVDDSEDYAVELVSLPPDLLVRWFRRCADAARPVPGLYEATFELFFEQVVPPTLTELAYPLAADPGIRRFVRLAAAAHLASVEDPLYRQLVPSLLAEEALAGELGNAEVYGALRQLARELPSGDREALMLELLGDSRIPVAVLDRFLPQAYSRQALTRRVTDEVLERYFDPTPEDPGEAAGMVRLAFDAATGDPTPRDVERIANAIRQPRWTATLTDYLAQSPDPRWTEILGEVLYARWIGEAGARENCGRAAAYALGNLLSDEAAELLLEAAPRVAPNVRKACMLSLEKIRLFREEVEKFHARRTTSIERDTAILDLLDMLEDPDPLMQAEAARALATLGTVDALPRLIRLLRSDEELVREAAREAIDRLNAVQGNSPGSWEAEK